MTKPSGWLLRHDGLLLSQGSYEDGGNYPDHWRIYDALREPLVGLDYGATLADCECGRTFTVQAFEASRGTMGLTLVSEAVTGPEERHRRLLAEALRQLGWRAFRRAVDGFDVGVLVCPDCVPAYHATLRLQARVEQR